MSTVQQIEVAIARLKHADQQKVATWMAAHCRNVSTANRLKALRKARGIWKNRANLPDINLMRRRFDRF